MAETEQDWRGKAVGGMSAAELEEFLARDIYMRLGCLDENGDPYITVVWHEWREGCFWVIPRQRSKWAEYLRNDPRCAFVIDMQGAVDNVKGKGLAELVEEPNVGGKWVEIAERMSFRYLGEHGPKYLVPTLKQPRWLFRIRPTEMTSWQGVGWARRYWVEGTGGPSYEEAHGLA